MRTLGQYADSQGASLYTCVASLLYIRFNFALFNPHRKICLLIFAFLNILVICEEK